MDVALTVTLPMGQCGAPVSDVVVPQLPWVAYNSGEARNELARTHTPVEIAAVARVDIAATHC
jgi:hypothetical protein